MLAPLSRCGEWWLVDSKGEKVVEKGWGKATLSPHLTLGFFVCLSLCLSLVLSPSVPVSLSGEGGAGRLVDGFLGLSVWLGIGLVRLCRSASRSASPAAHSCCLCLNCCSILASCCCSLSNCMARSIVVLRASSCRSAGEGGGAPRGTKQARGDGGGVV